METLEIFNPIYMHIIGARRRVCVSGGESGRWGRECDFTVVLLLQKEKGRVLFFSFCTKTPKYLISHPPLLPGQWPSPL